MVLLKAGGFLQTSFLYCWPDCQAEQVTAQFRPCVSDFALQVRGDRVRLAQIGCAAYGFGVQNGGWPSASPPAASVACSRSSPSLGFDGFCGRGSGTTNCTESQTRMSCERDVPSLFQVSVRRRPSTMIMSPFW